MIEILHSEPFQDKAPYEIHATLLDEGRYLCSIRTMYRILATCHGSVTERRRIVSRPHYVRPELIATTPNQVWSWDITKLKGPEKWTCFYLYVIIDIFSRYVVLSPKNQPPRGPFHFPAVPRRPCGTPAADGVGPPP